MAHRRHAARRGHRHVAGPARTGSDPRFRVQGAVLCHAAPGCPDRGAEGVPAVAAHRREIVHDPRDARPGLRLSDGSARGVSRAGGAVLRRRRRLPGPQVRWLAGALRIPRLRDVGTALPAGAGPAGTGDWRRWWHRSPERAGPRGDPGHCGRARSRRSGYRRSTGLVLRRAVRATGRGSRDRGGARIPRGTSRLSR